MQDASAVPKCSGSSRDVRVVQRGDGLVRVGACRGDVVVAVRAIVDGCDASKKSKRCPPSFVAYGHEAPRRWHRRSRRHGKRREAAARTCDGLPPRRHRLPRRLLRRPSRSTRCVAHARLGRCTRWHTPRRHARRLLRGRPDRLDLCVRVLRVAVGSVRHEHCVRRGWLVCRGGGVQRALRERVLRALRGGGFGRRAGERLACLHGRRLQVFREELMCGSGWSGERRVSRRRRGGIERRGGEGHGLGERVRARVWRLELTTCRGLRDCDCRPGRVSVWARRRTRPRQGHARGAGLGFLGLGPPPAGEADAARLVPLALPVRAQA